LNSRPGREPALLAPAGLPRAIGLHSPHGFETVEIPPGDAGTEATLSFMLAAIRGEPPFPPVDPRIRELAEDLIVRNGAMTRGERALIIYEWVRARVLVPQVRDAEGVEEVRSPGYILDRVAQYGRIPYDCDDTAILLAALLRSIGLSTRLVVVSTYASGREQEFSHVFAEVLTETGWLPLDPIIGREAGWTVRDVVRREEVPV